LEITNDFIQAKATLLLPLVLWIGKKTNGRGIVKQDATSVNLMTELLTATKANLVYKVEMVDYLYSKADEISLTEYKVLIDGIWSRDNFGGTGGLDQTAMLCLVKRPRSNSLVSMYKEGLR
jgi:hypothetical protein